MSEWKEIELGKLAEVQTGPFGSQLHQEDYVPVGTPLITVKNLGENKVTYNKLDFVSDQDKKRLSKFILKEGDIVFSRVGYVDRRAFITKKESGWLFSGSTLRVRVMETSILNPKYLSYYFGQKKFKDDIKNMSVGATRPSLNTQLLEEVEILLPPLPEQRAIASVFSSLDDKIDLLHRQNRTLEAMAEALFRQWFVEEAEEGWEIISLFDVIELVGGGTPKTEVVEYWDGNIKWISAKDITPNHKGFITVTEKTITEIGLENSSTKILPKYSTIISARGTVGKYCLLSENMAFSQSNYGIKPRYKDCFFFTYLLVAEAVDDLQAAAYGCVFDTITTSTFKEHKVSIPSEYEIKSFEETITPYFEKMLINNNQIRILTRMRDILLPRLMSGEMRVVL